MGSTLTFSRVFKVVWFDCTLLSLTSDIHDACVQFFVVRVNAEDTDVGRAAGSFDPNPHAFLIARLNEEPWRVRAYSTYE